MQRSILRQTKKVRKGIEKAKVDWITEQCSMVEEGMKRGNSKAAFDTLKNLTKTQQNKSPIIEDKDGEPLTESTAILDRWTEYCKELYKENRLNLQLRILISKHILNTVTIKGPALQLKISTWNKSVSGSSSRGSVSCGQCTSTFKDASALRSHRRTHNRNGHNTAASSSSSSQLNLICKVCHKQFSNHSQLGKHLVHDYG